MVCWAIFSWLYSINAAKGEILHRESNFFCDFLGWVVIWHYGSFKVAMGMRCFVNLIKLLKLFNFLILITL